MHQPNTENGLAEKTENEIKPVVHVEILQKPNSTLQTKNIEFLVEHFLSTREICDEIHSDFDNDELKKNVINIVICSDTVQSQKMPSNLLKGCHLAYHIYKLNSDQPGSEQLEDDLSAATHWLLPSKDFNGLWESLIYSNNVKSQLVNFVSTTLLFSEKHIDNNIILWNRVLLLHGPPGTGKTSLCQALAQKLTIRLSHKYAYGQLIEINSHSLFSRWFSESGKLVMKMFQKIQDLIDDPKALVFVLIDEVESLAHNRKASLGGSEPSDAVRVVNALLTQIDNIRRYPNVILLTTSNMTEAIDLAFVDRADIKQYIGLPSTWAIYEIYLSCIKELQRTGIIFPEQTLLTWKQLENTPEIGDNKWLMYSDRLRKIAKDSNGLSGRTLRKLPFLAHALFVQSPTCNLEQYLEALSLAVQKQFQDMAELNH